MSYFIYNTHNNSTKGIFHILLENRQTVYNKLYNIPKYNDELSINKNVVQFQIYIILFKFGVPVNTVRQKKYLI